MKNLIGCFTFILSILVFAACQKELNFEPLPNNGLAIGTLKSTSGNCLPKTVNGIYKKDQTLTSTNYIEVTADITTVGNYIIKSDTIAGFSFIGIGTVTTTGLNTIKLIGEGTPDSAGTKTFTIKFDTSICKIDVTVVSTVTNPNAVYTFNCGSTTFGTGIYTVNSPVGTTHTVSLSVNVTTLGSYAVNTSANGVSYAAAGTFTTLGANTILLTSNGTPTVAGPFIYTVTSGALSCAFTITVVAPPPAANLDYIPMTTNSNWTNRTVGTPPPNDTTFLQVSPNQKVFGANSYYIFERKVLGVPQDSSFFRKGSGLYYQYIADRVANQNVTINKEYLVLDSTKALNMPWSTNLGSIVVQTLPLDEFTITGKITAKGTTQTVESISYTNVLIVNYTYTAKFSNIPLTIATEERWFAKGIGIIKSVIDIQQPTPSTIETNLTRSQIF